MRNLFQPVLLLLLGVLLVGCSAAYAQSLHQSADLTLFTLSDSPRSAFELPYAYDMLLDADLLAITKLSQPASPPEIRLTIQLSETEARSATFSREDDSDGRYLWIGHLDGVPFRNSLLLIEGRNISGYIATETESYLIRPITNQTHALVKPKTQLAKHDQVIATTPPPLPLPVTSLSLPPTNAPIEMAKQPTFSTPPFDDGSVIDILFVYTTNAKNGIGSAAAIRNEIRAAVALTNQRFRDSQIDTVLNLTGFYETPYASTYDTSIDLQRFVDVDDGYMDEIHTLRNAQSADLAALITLRADDGSCGRGNQPSSLSHAWFDTSAFSINPLSFMYTNGQIYSCNMISVVGHEVGHNLSARHDWFVSSGQDSNHGYIDFDRQQRTVMAYSTACIQRNISCPRVDYYSNPDVSLSGGPLGGVQKYHGAYADNAWAINAYRVEAANYRWKNNPPSATGGLVYDSYWLYLQTGHSGAANKQVAKCGAPSYAQLITRNQSLEAQTNVTATLTTTDPYLTIEQDNTTTFADSLSGEVIPAQTYITLYFDVTTPMFHSAMAEVNITSSQGVITNTLAIKANCFPDQNDMHLPIVTNH